jgi:glycosyltransferase involved in cell wall biosynthesis
MIMLSFIVPAHNEETLIGRTLDALHAAGSATGLSYEIVVADDASTDRTSIIANEHGARVVQLDRRQIAASRNAGAREAAGEMLIFVDADTIVTKEVVRAAVDAMKAGAVGGGCGVDVDGQVPRYASFLMPALNRLFLLARIACGCFVFCRRSAFEAVGGFDEQLYASEEVYLSRALKRRGRFVVLRESVITSGRKLRTYTGTEVFRQFAHFALRGPASLRRREGLGLWYDERREDPELAVVKAGR